MNCLHPVTSGSIPPPIAKSGKIISALLILASLGAILGGVNGYFPFMAAQVGAGSCTVSLIAFGLLFRCNRPKSSAPTSAPATVNSTEVLVGFYAEGARDCAGRTLEDILGQDDAWLESQHDYIQWLFPTRSLSAHNPNAPLLNTTNIPQLRQHENIRRAFVRILQFYGLEWDGTNVKRAENWEERRQNWFDHTHNHLRITRIITSLRTLGFETEAQAFWDQLKLINGEHPTQIGGTTCGHWATAANGEI